MIKYKDLVKVKSFFLLVFLLGVFYSVNAQEITFESLVYDFGTISDQKPISVDYKFTNTGDKLLKINSVFVSCGCTVTEWGKNEYQPGEKGRIIVTYNPVGRKDLHPYLVVEVSSNAQNSGTQKGVHNLILKGNIIANKNTIKSDYKLLSASGKNKLMKNTVQPVDVYDRILSRVSNELRVDKIESLDKKVHILTTEVRRGGYWDDIDYKCFSRAKWEPVNHINNIRDLANAFTDIRSRYYGNDTLFQVISDALKYWIDVNPRSHNWWFNEIGYCQPLAETLVLLNKFKKQISPTIIDSLISKLLAVNLSSKTGANKIDVAFHQLFCGCILKNDILVSEIARQAFDPVRITSNEGIQEDLSFQQHGAQLYIGGYGDVFVEDIIKLQYYLLDTPFEMNTFQKKLFEDFFIKSYLSVFRGHFADFNVMGRDLTRRDILNQSKLIKSLEFYKIIDKKNAHRIDSVIYRFNSIKKPSFGISIQNINYWKSDFMLQNSPYYQASVRTESPKTIRTESLNGDNLLGEYLPFGALQIRCYGDEYFNIFPVWEWDKIPGVTSARKTKTKAIPYQTPGNSVYTGGVSNNKIGAYVYVQNNDGIRATKSYFFFENAIVALGAGIFSSIPEEIQTTINQCNLKGNVRVNNGNDKITYSTTQSIILNNPKWIYHDNIAYLFPNGGKLSLKAGIQSGNWARVDYNAKFKQIEMPVFNLVFEHGVKVNNGKYAYIMLPSISKTKDLDSYNDIRILSNTDVCQAVYQCSSNQYEINFLEPFTLEDRNFSITTDTPCSLLISRSDFGKWRVSVSDITKKIKRLKIKIKYNEVILEKDVIFTNGSTLAIEM